MPQKNKGSNTERELIHLFWQTPGWVACRVAGSGSMQYPSPDIIAGNSQRKVVVECKSSKDEYQYLTKEELKELLDFATLFNAEAWIAVRFSHEDWRFLHHSMLKETDKNFVIKREDCLMTGLIFKHFIEFNYS